MNKCKFKHKCIGYRKQSYTCNKFANRNYCGKYREFKKEKEIRKRFAIDLNLLYN